MKYKTLFRMLLKAIGVWVFAEGISSFGGSLLFYLGSLFLDRPGQVAFSEGFPLYLVHPVVQIAIGLYLFFGGTWIVDKAIPGNRPYCHECGYDLTDAAGNVCAECGTPFKPAAEASPAT